MIQDMIRFGRLIVGGVTCGSGSRFERSGQNAGRLLVALVALTYCSTGVWSQDSFIDDWTNPPEAQEPRVAAASEEAARAIPSFRVPEGWQVELFAAEPMVANPVSLFVDHDGTVLVCETFRQERGVEDNRGHGHWLMDDLQAQTIEDRLRYIVHHLGKDAVKYTEQDDRIRLLRDTRGDGRADISEVYADGFNTILSGTGAGVLRYRGRTYYTCIPDLWMFTEDSNATKAANRDVLHRGYGVRFAFRGHDSHGLVIGPDGRLYFSIGDRGYNVKTDSGHLKDPASGAVFRCNLDGSDLQVIATGLRNPQGLAFDDFGNLFTCDNNSDSGDQAKWFYIVPGGDYGWRMHYQYLGDRGPYNRERLWHPYDPATTPAYIIPPIANVSDGPSGLDYYPGTGFSEDWQGSFVLCDFRGQKSSSGIRRLKNESNGAFFRLSESEEPIWHVLSSDLKFSADGELYVLDWVEGWTGEGKGRIYRMFDPRHRDSADAKSAKKWLRGGISQGTAEQLVALLAHPDRRVRQESQFELVRRSEWKRLLEAADGAVPAETPRLRTLARVHGIWGCMQYYRETRELPSDFQEGIDTGMARWWRDSDPEVRAIAAQQAGELRHPLDWSGLVALIADSEARVAAMAMLTVGQQKLTLAWDDVLKRLNDNNNQDPILRHAGIMAIAGLDPPDQWSSALEHTSPAVRLAAVAAMRRTRSAKLQSMLSDGDVLVATEAARAIYDLPMEDQLTSLSNQLLLSGANDAFLRRSLNAAYRLGTDEQAKRLVEFASSQVGAADRRVESLERLQAWGREQLLDPVLNEYRPRPAAAESAALNAIRGGLPQLLAGDPQVAEKAVAVAAEFGITEVEPILRDVVANREESGKTRADALRSWYRLAGEDLRNVLMTGLDDSDPAVRAASVQLMAKIDRPVATKAVVKALRDGAILEKQAGLQTVSDWSVDEAQPIIDLAFELKLGGKLPLESELELRESLEALGNSDWLATYTSMRAAEIKTGGYKNAEWLLGGDPDLGRKVFFEKTEVSCVRCHAVNEVGGGVGPNLSNIGKLKERTYLLEAILDPNAAIAEGFATQLILDIDGVTHAGIVTEENDEWVELVDADGQRKRIQQDDIEERQRGQSSMPADLSKKMSSRELRDLVAYLASLQAE